MKVDDSGRVPIKMWTDEIEPQALVQLQNIAKMPFIVSHVAAMPDVHLGVGATVGSVIAAQGAIMPAAVGVDIGCGMMAVKTTLNAEVVQANVKKIRSSIERSIPVGFNGNRRIEDRVNSWGGWENFESLTYGTDKLKDKARSQLGSLGGGNHFIELCLDTEGAVWVMLHSGSRGIGNQLASRHIESAKGLMKKMFIDLPDPDLAYFVQGTKEFTDYLFDLHWSQSYAMQNRVEMMERVMKDLAFAFNNGEAIHRELVVNCHHNYASQENHFGKNVWLTRKGAVSAKAGELGIIPGSMGTKSYIVRGLGNPMSFCSCSHGAGRRMSRGEARRTFNNADLLAQTTGVECRKDDGVIDEIPGAYKDIDTVMANQSDLVEIVATLKQFLCIKG